MKKQSSGSYLLTLAIIALIFTLPWIVNAFKFAGCDFKSDWKCEIIHGAGIVVPPASYVTVWFASDKGNNNE